ncbi:MAG: U32 family peptidase, partial [Firmicutes bacterium]|nr:U32 family peptidase [Bacillota bacterium]
MSTLARIELLSPCGNMDCVKAAVNNGADAIYIGGKQFSARQYAGNFSITEIMEVCDYCHLRNVKVFLTVNTLYKDKELNDLLKFVSSVYEAGVDALIVQDMGAAEIIRKNFPDFPLHASTQLTANSLEDVNALEKAGFERVVLSRELSLEEIKHITDNAAVPVETFVHGALCVSYSGQCIMSSMLGGRSGNRGRCAQTCRLPFALHGGYKKIREGHLLSTKDIAAITCLPQIIEAGVSSLKVEGRMKSAEYVAGVTKVYRKYIDMYYENPEEYKVDEKDMKVLLQLFNRGGFSEGYYTTHSGLDMMSPERPKSWGLKAGIVDTYDRKYGRTSIRTREPLLPGDGIEIWTQSEPHAGSNINKASRPGEVISMIIKGDIAKNDVVYKTHDKALYDDLARTYQKDTRTKNIYGHFTAYAGKPITLKLWDMEGNSVFVTGEEAQEASNQPVSEEKIKQQLMKTGGTSFAVEEMTLECGDNIYIGISAVNALRREAVEELTKKVIMSGRRKHRDITS